MVSQNFRQALEAQKAAFQEKDVIAGVFQSIAVQRNIEIPKELVDFMRLVVYQSLDFRQEEWAVYPPDIVQLRVQSVLGDIARGTRTYAIREGKPILSLTSVLENIKNRWCDIYPIC